MHVHKDKVVHSDSHSLLLSASALLTSGFACCEEAIHTAEHRAPSSESLYSALRTKPQVLRGKLCLPSQLESRIEAARCMRARVRKEAVFDFCLRRKAWAWSMMFAISRPSVDLALVCVFPLGCTNVRAWSLQPVCTQDLHAITPAMWDVSASAQDRSTTTLS